MPLVSTSSAPAPASCVSSAPSAPTSQGLLQKTSVAIRVFLTLLVIVLAFYHGNSQFLVHNVIFWCTMSYLFFCAAVSMVLLGYDITLL